MVIADAVFLKIPLIRAGGDDAGVFNGNRAEICFRPVRVLQADRPRAAVRLLPHSGNIAAKGNDRGRDARFLVWVLLYIKYADRFIEWIS